MRGPESIDAPMLDFLAERHLATLTTLRDDGSPHVVAVGFGYDADDRTVRILTLEGTINATTDPERVARAVAAYAKRYGEPKQRPDRVALEIVVDRILGRG